MDSFAVWSLLIGGVLVLMALASTVLARLPLSTAMFYLVVGVGVSPLGLGMADLDPLSDSLLLERLSEVVVLVSLFSAGLKLSQRLDDGRWLLPLRLATLSMLVTVGLITAVGWGLLGLPLGAALLLGGILAPTDPVLASEVQVQDPGDRDELRMALTGEGGLNDGTAFPVVLLGLLLLQSPAAPGWWWHWLLRDVLWAVAAGLATGAGLGWAVGKLVLYLRRAHQEAVGLDDFLTLGLIALAYGTAVLLAAYGFLAVFAAGLALRRLVQRQAPSGGPSRLDAGATAGDQAHALAVHPQHAPAYMAQAVLGFNERLERIGEVAAVVVTGALLWSVEWRHVPWWFVPLVLLVVRPLAVLAGLAGSGTLPVRRRLIAWFGIRGVGSLYYLAYAFGHGLPAALAAPLAALTLSLVVASIVLHGVSVTPLMRAYERRMGRRPA